jgi:hypothetical protein
MQHEFESEAHPMKFPQLCAQKPRVNNKAKEISKDKPL